MSTQVLRHHCCTHLINLVLRKNKRSWIPLRPPKASTLKARKRKIELKLWICNTEQNNTQVTQHINHSISRLYMQVVCQSDPALKNITKLISQIWTTPSKSTINPSGFNYRIVLLSTSNRNSFNLPPKMTKLYIEFKEMTTKLSCRAVPSYQPLLKNE